MELTKDELREHMENEISINFCEDRAEDIASAMREKYEVTLDNEELRRIAHEIYRSAISARVRMKRTHAVR